MSDLNFAQQGAYLVGCSEERQHIADQSSEG